MFKDRKKEVVINLANIRKYPTSPKNNLENDSIFTIETEQGLKKLRPDEAMIIASGNT